MIDKDLLKKQTNKPNGSGGTGRSCRFLRSTVRRLRPYEYDEVSLAAGAALAAPYDEPLLYDEALPYDESPPYEATVGQSQTLIRAFQTRLAGHGLTNKRSNAHWM